MKTEAIDRFLTRVRTASQTKAKDVRMTIDEAVELSTLIGQILAKNVELRERVANETIEVKVSGGRF